MALKAKISVARDDDPSRANASKRTAILALAPFVLFLLVFAVYPLAGVVRLAFSSTRVVDSQFVFDWSGFENFAAVLNSPVALASAWTTVIFVITTVAGSVFLGVAIALIVDRAVFMKSIARNILVWPAVITPVVVSVLWLLMLDPTVGGLNKMLLSLGLPAQGWLNHREGALGAIILVDIWHWTPLVYLFMFTALKGIGNEIVEAARVDGAGEWRIVRSVILPILWPSIAVVCILRAIMGIKAFDEMYLLTRGGPDYATNPLSLHIRTMFFDELNYGYAAAASLLIVAFVAAGVGLSALTRVKST